MPAKVQSKQVKIIVICFLAAIAGLLFGLDTGVISGAQPLLTQEFGLTEQTTGLVVTSLMIGATIGVIFAGWLSFRIGRKYSLIIAAILFVVGSIICGITPNVEILIAARLLLGVAVGIASYAAPLYLSEVAPEKIRGSMISLYQLLITIGILAAFLSDLALTESGAWRWMLGIVTIPAVVLLVGIMFVPRSPRWLASKGRIEKAQQVLNDIRDTPQEAKQELDDIIDSLKIKQSGWNLFKENTNFRRAVGLGVILQVMQQFTGINVIMYFAPEILKVAGFPSATDQMWGTVIIGIVNVLATFIAIGVVDSWGRRKTLILGFAVMAFGMGALSMMLYINSANIYMQYGVILTLLIFVVGFAMSAGPLVWVLCSEIQPLKGRDFGVTVSTATNWIANALLSFVFLILLNMLGGSVTFFAFAVFNVVSIFITLWIVPETKNISLEHIEANLMAGKRLRDIGQPISKN